MPRPVGRAEGDLAGQDNNDAPLCCPRGDCVLPGQKWTHRDGNGSGFFGGGPATFRSGDPCLF